MIIRAILILLLAFIAQPASAVTNYGKWLCTDCVVETLPTNVAIPAAGELAAFIKAQVNQAVNSHVWRANDYVTICDGHKALPYFTVPPAFICRPVRHFLTIELSIEMSAQAPTSQTNPPAASGTWISPCRGAWSMSTYWITEPAMRLI